MDRRLRPNRWSRPHPPRPDQEPPFQVRRPPPESTVAQNEVVGHDTDERSWPESSPSDAFQVEPFQVNASPVLSTAAQTVGDAQETVVGTDSNPPDTRPPLCCVHVDPFQMSVPPFSTTMQKVAETQETVFVGYVVSDALDHVVPFHVNALNASSTAAQKVDVGHDTEIRDPESTRTPADQVLPFQVNALPSAGVPLVVSPTATQKFAAAQDTDFNGPPGST